MLQNLLTDIELNGWHDYWQQFEPHSKKRLSLIVDLQIKKLLLIAKLLFFIMRASSSIHWQHLNLTSFRAVSSPQIPSARSIFIWTPQIPLPPEHWPLQLPQLPQCMPAPYRTSPVLHRNMMLLAEVSSPRPWGRSTWSLNDVRYPSFLHRFTDVHDPHLQKK